jgi:hypothetical protein
VYYTLSQISCSAAANAAGIPSVLLTNFTFDSVYSYLSTLLVDEQDAEDSTSKSLGVHVPSQQSQLVSDIPIPGDEVEPLVQQLWQGYRCADLLLRLPGAIPIPSFSSEPALPSPEWVDIETRRFSQSILDHLFQATSEYTLLPQIPFPNSHRPKSITRSVISTPLVVRSPNPVVYTVDGRHRLLDMIGVPRPQQDDPNMKILTVSFGGQVFHKPPSHSRSHSRIASTSSTPVALGCPVLGPSNQMNGVPPFSCKDVLEPKQTMPPEPENARAGIEALMTALESTVQNKRKSGSLRIKPSLSRNQSLLMIPGAPAASVPTSPLAMSVSAFPSVVPPTPELDSCIDVLGQSTKESKDSQDDVFGTLLPDESWIAVVCGVSKDWAIEDGEALPDNFYVAPKDIYMPDLTAVTDVLLGKLVREPHYSVSLQKIYYRYTGIRHRL